uniref:DNA primase putative n=1 Tax=Albugo laibachii Nc14 TaxID=890382 RepID=F0WIK9_9STRA|nr:DNA primase putative [Albugo laibachii Nc14]|eukprot:CCA21093.1 DNA primase putative [Albugo laibachii Nc14]
MRQFYPNPPNEPFTLEEFEFYSHCRLEVLLAIHHIKEHQNGKDLYEECMKNVSQDAQQVMQNMAQDSYSHYILRVAACVSKWTEWFIDMETKLFRMRICREDCVQALHQAFAVSYRIVAFDSLTHSEKNWMRATTSQNDIHKSRFYMVPFTECNDLIRDRRVLIRDGFCVLPKKDLIHVICYHFRSKIVSQMKTLKKGLAVHQQEIKRLTFIFDKLTSYYASKTYTATYQQAHEGPPFHFTLETIDHVASRHYPLCMQHLHDKLREHHHLKYNGRLQYRLFLKSLGFKVEENLRFWNTEFTKKISEAEFQKRYAYSIRHTYGLEGGRKDFEPYNCQQLSDSAPPKSGQYHGCPFKHWSSATLEVNLNEKKIGRDKIIPIIKASEYGKHQTACQLYFEAMHPLSAVGSFRLDNIGLYPSEYLYMSIRAFLP